MKQIRLMQQYQCGWTPNPKLIRLEPPVFASCDDEDYEYLIQTMQRVVMFHRSGDWRGLYITLVARAWTIAMRTSPRQRPRRRDNVTEECV